MKQLHITNGIVPLGEFKAKASAMIRDLNKSASPLVITQNGRPAAVVLAPAEYDRLQADQKYLEAVAHGARFYPPGR